MSKPQWWRKLQYHRRQKRRITSGLIYHKHCNQVIVSKQELYIQLKESWFNENLLACLAFGPDHPQYAYWLLMASIKFWFIGSSRAMEHPAGVLSHPQFGDIMRRLAGKMDYIILDTSPMAVAADAEYLMAAADTVAIVVRQDWTDVRSVNEAVDNVRQSKTDLAGFVLNAFMGRRMVFGRYDKYGYYRYGQRRESDAR